MIFPLLFVLLYSILPVSHHFVMEPGDEERDPEHFKFNKEGILTIDGTVPGISDPIFFDKRNKNKYCALRQYYVFTFCPKNKRELVDKHNDCAEGIIFCYEGQLSPEKSRPTYALPNVENEISRKCKDFHGFKVAMHYLKKRTPKDVGSFVYLEVKTSYMDKSYYFQLPDSSCIDLFMGNDDNLVTAVRTAEHDYRVEKPTQVHLNNGSIVGINYDPNMPYEEFMEEFTKLPEPENFGRYRDGPHLNMLFLDFKTQYPEAQMMFTIAPENNCNMVARVQSNMINECKANFKQKNFALRSYGHGNSTTDYVLTIESGIETTKTSGNRRTDSKSDNTGSGGGNYNEEDEFQFNGIQNEQENVQEYRNGMLEFKGDKGVAGSKIGVTGEATPIGVGPISSKVGAGAGLSFALEDGSLEKYIKVINEQTLTRHNDASSKSIKDMLDKTYRHLTTDTLLTGKKTFNSQTVGVQRRTIFKWIVKVPAKHIMTPMQMQMDCDGAQVKIPWLKFVLTEDGEDQPLVEYE